MADLHGLVVRNEAEEVVGVDEGQIALALLKGQKELLSEVVQSQWGPVHLFDVCLRCDHLGMALALAAHGVPGCVLEDHHLGPSSRDSPMLRWFSCGCRGWDTCPYCCWAFPVEQGIWMEDWDEALLDWDPDQRPFIGFIGAIPAAQKAAATPLTRAMLDLCSRQMELPFSGSLKAMARLLDIAILTGNQKAAVNLAQKSHLRPLRRWALWSWAMNSDGDDFWKAARTALLAGANLQDLMVKYDEEEIPFPQALFLPSKLQDWQKIRHLLPRGHDLWRPKNLDNEFGDFFLECPRGPRDGLKLSLDKIHSAEDAGVDLKCLFVAGERGAWVTLLDMAIWCGQPNCAEACVDGGIELKDDDVALDWHQRVLRGEELSLSLTFPSLDDPFLDLDVAPSEAQIAAAAAGRAWLKRLWKSECSKKGVVLYQMMEKMFKGTSFPTPLVQEILTFSMPVPKIIDQLDLWEHVIDWMASICGGPFAPAAAHVGGMDVKVESATRVQGPCASDQLQLCSTAALETAAEHGPVSSDAKSTDELMMALQASRDEIPALNIDGVCLFRLTRNATCPRVTALLLDPTGPLASLHQRVWEAGCQVNPEWNPVKALFVPITEAQMDELQGLSEQGYELSKEYHLLALQRDENEIVEAIRSNMPYKNRPKLKKVGPEVPSPGADERDQDVNYEEDGPLLVLEAGIRTDSSVGFPSYPTGSQ